MDILVKFINCVFVQRLDSLFLAETGLVQSPEEMLQDYVTLALGLFLLFASRGELARLRTHREYQRTSQYKKCVLYIVEFSKYKFLAEMHLICRRLQSARIRGAHIRENFKREQKICGQI